MTCRRQYDPRIREAIYRTQNSALFSDLSISRTTRAGWLRGDFLPTVTSPLLSKSEVELIEEVHRLRERARWLTALVRVLVVLVRVSDTRLDGDRLPEGQSKRRILRTIESVKGVLGLDAALRVVGLSSARYHRWRIRSRDCDLDDRPSCRRSHPSQLPVDEVATIRQMVTGIEYRHMALRTLALFAQRTGRVFAAPRTWMKLARNRGWARPRRRLYPPKPKVGVRAERPNEYWHIDVTVIGTFRPPWTRDRTKARSSAAQISVCSQESELPSAGDRRQLDRNADRETRHEFEELRTAFL